MPNHKTVIQESRELSPASTGWLTDFPPRRRHLLLAGVCVAAVYLAGVTGRWWPTPDSALYLGLARSLADGQGYQFNGSPCNMVAPGLPAILAGLRILFGPGFWALNLLMALCGLAATGLIYLSIARLSDRRTALAVALATALSYTFFNNCHRILTDAPFAALFWAILYAYIRYRSGSARWLILAGLLSIAAVVVRAPGILLLGSLAISIVPDRGPVAQRRKGLVPACVILAILAVLGAGLFIVARQASDEVQIYAGAITAKINAGPMVHLRSIGLGLAQLPLTTSEMLTGQETYFVGLPALLLAGVGGVSLWKRRQRFVLPLIVVSVLALAFYGKDHFVRPRYLMPIQPLLLLTMMEGLCWCIRRFYRPAGAKLLLKAVSVLVGVIIVCNAPKIIRNAFYYSYISHTPRYYNVIKHGRSAELINVAEVIRRDHPDGRQAATNSDEVSILHFLSERVITPTPKTARREQNRTAHAEEIHQFATSHSRLKFIVLDTGKPRTDDPLRRRLKELFENTPGMELRHDGKRYLVYESAPTKGAQK